MSFWQAAAAIFVAVLLWASVHPSRQAVRDALGRSKFVVRVARGSFPIDRVNQVLGVNIHYITRYQTLPLDDGMEDVRLDFAGLTSAARSHILSDLRKFSPSGARLETAVPIAILKPIFSAI